MCVSLWLWSVIKTAPGYRISLGFTPWLDCCNLVNFTAAALPFSAFPGHKEPPHHWATGESHQGSDGHSEMPIFYEYYHWWQSHGAQSGFRIDQYPLDRWPHTHIKSHIFASLALIPLFTPPNTCLNMHYWHPAAPRTHSSSHLCLCGESVHLAPYSSPKSCFNPKTVQWNRAIQKHILVEWGFWYSVCRNQANTRNRFI